MVGELVDRDEAFLDLSSLVVHTLANIQKTLTELENSLMINRAYQYRYIIPLSVSPTHSSLDYSSYFEPIIDPAPFASERTENTECCAPDVSDCFEPVAPCQPKKK